MLAFRLLALAIFAAAAFSAQGIVLVYEGFHPADYGNVPADGEAQVNTTFTAGHTIGVSTSKWGGPSGAMTKVYGENYGLSFSSKMAAYGFKSIGGSVGMSPGSDSADMRAKYHTLASNVLKASVGTNLYFRVLLNVDSAAADKLTAVSEPASASGKYFGCGFTQTEGSSYYLLTCKKSALAFVVWKNKSNQCVLSFAHTTASGTTATFYPLVTDITLGETYVCYAEVKVGAGTDNKEVVRAGAVAGAFTGDAPWAKIGDPSDSIEVELITDSSYPTVMAVAGPYGTNGGYFRADEFVVGTELGDILPVGSLFAVWPIGTSTVGPTSFSNDWALFADDGVTADAGLVWSTDETFATATTNSLGTGLVADTRTASLTGLEPGTTYWWKIYADKGTETAETPVGSFTTTGAPILGSATVTATAAAETATFSVALTEAAMSNTLTTSVSVFYGTNGVDWTELPLGSALGAESFSDTVGNLGYGVTYRWFASATATMEGGRVLSDSTATNSFTTLWNGDMYVDAAAANASKPYNTPGTAAKTIAAAISLALDGATIHIAPGRYNISTPLSLTKAIELVGDNTDPSCVVVSNTASVAWGNTNHRCILVNHANARVSGMTFENGKDYGNGGNVRIDTNGGVVTNCILSGGFTREGNDSAGANVAITGPGLVTHCKIYGGNQNNCSGGDRVSSAYLEHANARIENCLVEGFKGATVSTQPTAGCAGILVNKGAAVNCTVADCTSPYTTASGFSGISVWANGVATNCVSVCNVDSNGTLRAFSSGQVSRTSHCAFDAIAGEAAIPEGMPNAVVGTAAEFFDDYANGDYTPKADGPLVNAGANYAGVASVDLAGNPRTTGKNVDIGAYECQKTKGLLIFVR